MSACAAPLHRTIDGLRDYQTGRWEGGSLPECAHLNRHGLQGETGQRADRTFTGSQNFYRHVCAKCGAVRVDQQIGPERTPTEYKRDARLTYGARGSDKPWMPRGKHSATEPNSSGRRVTESIALARANGAPHDMPFGQTRNQRSVWTINVKGFPEAHFAVFPEKLARLCIAAGCPPGGTSLDPFMGSGTTLLVAEKLGCHGIGIELSADYCEIAKRRLAQPLLDLQEDQNVSADG